MTAVEISFQIQIGGRYSDLPGLAGWCMADPVSAAAPASLAVIATKMCSSWEGSSWTTGVGIPWTVHI